MDYSNRSIVYLDYNATAPIDERVLDEMISVYRNVLGNADSRTHEYGSKASKVVSESKNKICEILGISDTELIITSGSTESNNMAIQGLCEYAKQTGRNHFITSSIEHKSVLETMKHLQRIGCEVDFIDPDASGRVSAEKVLAAIKDTTAMVSVMHVNSETGVIQPVKEIGMALKDTPVYFHVDATQSFGKLNDEIRATHYDMLSFTAHKFGGPQGIGGLVLRRDKRYRLPPIQPIHFGGQQERGMRPGTTPVALIAGMAKAAEISAQECVSNMDACTRIKNQFMDSIKDLRYSINGSEEYCMPNTINISFDGVDAEGIFVALKNQYAFSNGSACNSGSFKPSYVLAAMGLTESRIDEAIRISWSGKTEVDFTGLVQYIKQVQ